MPLQKLKILFRGHISLVILKVKKLLERFTKNEFQKTNQNEFRVKKVNKGKCIKLYVKWKHYDNSFNSWIDNERLSVN